MFDKRFKVAKKNISWMVFFPNYKPFNIEDKSLETKYYAETNDAYKYKKFISYNGIVLIDNDGKPLNPNGRTGLCGRGVLGKWGPNFAADPLITRTLFSGEKEILLIERFDTNTWALPGGMVDFGEIISDTASRELFEETGVDIDMSDADEIFRGYVKDPRNTDNAWIETIVFHKHFDDFDPKINIQESEVRAAKWFKVSDLKKIKIYANHRDFIKKVLK